MIQLNSRGDIVSKKVLVFSLVCVLAIGFLFAKYSEYKEKSLDEIFTHNVKEFKSMTFDIYNDDRLSTDKKDAMSELTEFLSQYQVKKMKNADWNPDVSTEKGYSLDIHSENKIIMVGFYEERIHIFDEGYYKVINGPIDIEWLQSLEEKYRQ